MLIADDTLLAADWLQTRQISELCTAHVGTWRELNPLLGKCPSQMRVAAHFAASALAIHYLANTLEPRYRKAFLTTVGVMEFTVVEHNLRVGISIKF